MPTGVAGQKILEMVNKDGPEYHSGNRLRDVYDRGRRGIVPPVRLEVGVVVGR